MTEVNEHKYDDLDFDSVESIVELAEMYTKGPYQDSGETSSTESYGGIISQYNNAPRNNYENAAPVFYLDRSGFAPEKKIEMKAMWFDEDGHRVAKPVRKNEDE